MTNLPVDLGRSRITPIVLGGMLAVVGFDALGSLAARQLGFSYALLIPGSLLIYGVVAALVARRRDWVVGVFAAMGMAVTDLTLGWAVSWIIGPGRPEGGFTTMTIIGAGMTAFVLGGLAGAIGAWIGVRGIRGPSVLAVTALAWSARPAAGQHTAPSHWEYEGSRGPVNWGTLDTAYRTCLVGKQQSPIDISHVRAEDLPALTFSYRPSPLRLIDNGHTVQVTYMPGSFITVGDQRYELQQFHFHHPAEEKVFGKSYPMVAHFVHKNEAGRLAVVAVLLTEGTASGLVDKIWRYLPDEQGKDVSPDGASIDATELLPAARGYFTYGGSLTTPPCSEGVSWFVLKQPTQVSREEVATFAKKYPHNARPLQPRNGRVIRETP